MSCSPPPSGVDPVIEVFGMYVFQLGEMFDSFEEVEERLRKHSERNFVTYWRRDTRTVKGELMKTARPIAARLKYYSIRYACVHGGQKVVKRGQGHRSKQSMRTGCPSYIMLRADKDGQRLEVIGVCNRHNHPISETDSRLLPQNRRMPVAVQADVLQMMHHRIDRKKIIAYVRHKCGKQITTKDLFNLKATATGSTKLANDVEDDAKKVRSSAKTRQEWLSEIKSLIDDNRSVDPNENEEELSASCAAAAPSEVVDEPPTIVSNDLLQDLYYEIIDDGPDMLSEEFDVVAHAESRPGLRHTDCTEMTRDAAIDAYCVDPESRRSSSLSSQIADDPMVLFAQDGDKDFEDIIIEDTTNAFTDDEDCENDEAQMEDSSIETEKQPDDDELHPDTLDAEDSEHDTTATHPIDYDESTTPSPVVYEPTDPNVSRSPSSLLPSVQRKSMSIDFTRKKLRARDSSAVRSINTTPKNCRHCGLNAKLVRMQIAVLKAQKLKLDEETQILRLNKVRLLAEVQRYGRAIE